MVVPTVVVAVAVVVVAWRRCVAFRLRAADAACVSRHGREAVSGLDARSRERNGVPGNQVCGEAKTRRKHEPEQDESGKAHGSRLDAAG